MGMDMDIDYDNKENVSHQGNNSVPIYRTNIEQTIKEGDASSEMAPKINSYTKAIQAIQISKEFANEEMAEVLFKRGNAFVIVGAFQLGVSDFQWAFHLLSGDQSGLFLRAKAKIKLMEGQAFLKLGEGANAIDAFTSIRTSILKASGEYESLLNDANHGITVATQFQVLKAGCQELGNIDKALLIAPGCAALHRQKIGLLEELKRWREIAIHCEYFAALNTMLDGCFEGNLASQNPFPGVPPASALTCDAFGDHKEHNICGATIRLSPEAVSEAILRIPHDLARKYLRALRLEERYPESEAALRMLDAYNSQRTGVCDWIDLERDMLRRTKSEREGAGELFRNGDFKGAAKKYAACRDVDPNAGGSLHAALHHNHAVCLMKMNEHQEAVSEFNAALGYHPQYMKAILYRARCYHSLGRYEEYITELKNYLRMVSEAKGDPQNLSLPLPPCLFGGPHDVSDDDAAKVKLEMDKMLKAIDYYSVLQVERNADSATIKKAYKKLVLQYHPDKNKDPRAVDEFRRVQEAYETLNDPALRRKYDSDSDSR